MNIERGIAIPCANATEAVDRLESIYEASKAALRDAFHAFVDKGTTPSPAYSPRWAERVGGSGISL